MLKGGATLALVFVAASWPASVFAMCDDAACVRCDSDQSKCDECTAGWFARGGACIACTNVIPFCNTVVCVNAGGATCTSCAPGTYLERGACLPCMTVPGCAVTVICNAPRFSQCRACAPGRYRLAGQPDTCESCTPVAGCAPNNVTCTNGGDSQCATCGPGTFIDGGTCVACSTCPEGTPPVSECTARADTACITCPEGSFAPPGTIECTACGDCNDGDDCTLDVCDPTRGCTHTPDPSCAPAVKQPTEPPGGDCNAGGGGILALLAVTALVLRAARPRS